MRLVEQLSQELTSGEKHLSEATDGSHWPATAQLSEALGHCSR